MHPVVVVVVVEKSGGDVLTISSIACLLLSAAFGVAVIVDYALADLPAPEGVTPPAEPRGYAEWADKE